MSLHLCPQLPLTCRAADFLLPPTSDNPHSFTSLRPHLPPTRNPHPYRPRRLSLPRPTAMLQPHTRLSIGLPGSPRPPTTKRSTRQRPSSVLRLQTTIATLGTEERRRQHRTLAQLALLATASRCHALHDQRLVTPRVTIRGIYVTRSKQDNTPTRTSSPTHLIALCHDRPPFSP